MKRTSDISSIFDAVRTFSQTRSLTQAWALAVAIASTSVVSAAPYELRVYSDDTPKKGESEIELLVSMAQPKLVDDAPRGRVIQTLLEYGYGLDNGWSIGLELPMSHENGHNTLSGLKVETQYVAEHNTHQGMYWGVRGDVGYTSSPYETQGGNSLDINPILGYRWLTWHVVVNPSIEIPLSGRNTHTQFQPSAKIARRVNNSTQLGVEYFSGWGALSAIRPQRERDETLYLVWDEQSARNRWNVGLGKPMNPSGGSVDKWVVKIGVNLDLD
jgi:hypothetical protein